MRTLDWIHPGRDLSSTSPIVVVHYESTLLPLLPNDITFRHCKLNSAYLCEYTLFKQCNLKHCVVRYSPYNYISVLYFCLLTEFSNPASGRNSVYLIIAFLSLQQQSCTNLCFTLTTKILQSTAGGGGTAEDAAAGAGGRGA